MMFRLMLNHLRRTWKLGLFAAAATFAFQALVIKVFQAMTTGPEAAQSRLFGRMMPKWMTAAMGLERPMNEIAGFLSAVYQHPFLLAVIIAVPLGAAAALLAGEAEKRTLALLLCRPVSRMQIVLSAAFVCVFWPALAAAGAWGGTWAGLRWTGVTPPDMRMLAFAALNLYLLALACGGLALAVSAMVAEKGDAVGWCVTLLLGMYVANFLVQIWPKSAPIGDYLLFHYYTPARMLIFKTLAVQNFQILGAAAAGGLFAALVIFWRRPFSL